jgi:hypothetical protein
MSKAKGNDTQIVNASKVRQITRRNLIAGGTAVLAVAGAALPSQALNADAETDPVVILWRQYQPAEDEARRLGDRIVEIEAELPEHPGVNLGMMIAFAPVGMEPVGPVEVARYAEDIERWARDMMSGRAGFDDATREAWIEARKAELVEVNRQVKEREKAAGLPKLRGEQDRLDGISGDLYSQIETGTATTPGGLAVKLLIAFEHTENRDAIEDLPYCLYVSMLRDLLPLCPADVAARARVYVEAEADHSRSCLLVGDCLAQIRCIDRAGVGAS